LPFALGVVGVAMRVAGQRQVNHHHHHHREQLARRRVPVWYWASSLLLYGFTSL
jgi:hypothetical protein